MHLILASIGTDGDVLPYVGLGTVMRHRGHRVTLAAPGDYRALAARHDLEFAELMSIDETEALIGRADFWHPLKGPWVASQFAAKLIERQYALLAELAREDHAVIAANPGVVVARVVQERLRRPLASVLLQPWMIKSSIAPPVMPGGLTLPAGMPSAIADVYWWLVDTTGDFLVNRHSNRLRKALGMPSRRGVGSWLSPELVIGMFPSWYGKPQADWPRQVKLTGFARFDGTKGAEMDGELLEFCRVGTPPAVFSFGTGFRHGKEMFAAATEACQAAGMRGIFLTRYPEQSLGNAESITTRRSVPFRALFPHCGAVVHHGGIGTVAEALAAGVPQLVLPVAWDQEDNARRIERLGVGQWLGRRNRGAAELVKALTRLKSEAIKARCKEVARLFEEERPLEAAASALEALAQANGL